jgi:hypothetical protein
MSGLLATLLTLAAPPAITQTDPDCISGSAVGGWDLPTAPDDIGHVRGVLALGDGTRRFLLGAELHPERLRDGHHGGRIDGLLRLPGVDRPVAEVHGFYVLRRDGSGEFRATIVRPPSDRDDHPTRIGRIEGLFRDPHPDSVGRFRARWMICR